ncbi:MAG: hypothetical protein OXC63_06885 [Aestuariivita sp.]|nr:hypothetical protein [Aestuariivita sp.]MCY4345943.1 hypothetical protein [Aestuariivita sp.]
MFFQQTIVAMIRNGMEVKVKAIAPYPLSPLGILALWVAVFQSRMTAGKLLVSTRQLYSVSVARFGKIRLEFASKMKKWTFAEYRCFNYTLGSAPRK